MEKKILRVNMSTGQIRSESVPKPDRYLGGRGLTSTIVAREVPPDSHPLSEDNKLVIAPGILSGTTAPCSGRLSVGGKSPLTGGVKEANVGGTASQKIARLGYAAIVVEGAGEPGKLFGLKVDKEGASLFPAEEWEELDNYALVGKIRENHGEKVSTITIGTAGERRFSMASVAVSDMDGHPARHAGRGGLGAVMGSKNLKAVAFRGTHAVEVAHPKEYRDLCLDLIKREAHS